MTAEAYYKSLTQEQKESYQKALRHADDIGIDLVVDDAIDVWYLIAKEVRGEKPVFCQRLN